MMFKLQLPLAGGNEIYAYNESRRVSVFLKKSPELMRLFGHNLKIYVEATQKGKGLEIHSVVSKAQGW